MLLGKHTTKTPPTTYGAITLYGAAFQRTSTPAMFSYFATG